MTKNTQIHVFDANGNEIGQTYPKRAQGLLKKGRARSISDDAIVLTDEKYETTEACPPDIHHSEELNMFENIAEFNDSAEVLETAAAGIEGESTIPEELQRLYAKLDEIDVNVREFSYYYDVSTEGIDTDANPQTVHEIFEQRGYRLTKILDTYKEMREDTIHMIEAYKKNDAKKMLYEYIAAQSAAISEQLEDNLKTLAVSLQAGTIDGPEYQEKYDAFTSSADNRIERFLNSIN